jgi:predicted nicotinamide N-methyase
MKTPDKSTQELFDLIHSKSHSEDHQHLLQDMIDSHLPSWFAPMLNDKSRNNFYFKMIEKHVPKKTVLEIGAGIGLMSIHAAKSGAKHVYACELNPFLYALAKENIEKSGYAKKITLFLGHSDDLLMGTHIPSKVDIILSELISTDIFSEYLVPSLERAEIFLKKEGIFLPGTMNIKGCLVTLKEDLKSYLVPTHPEFKRLSDFSKKRSLMVDLSGHEHTVVSEGVELFKIHDGYKVDREFPITIELEKTKRTKNTYFCLYFELQDGRNKLANFGLKKVIYSHWSTLLWKLEDHSGNYKIKLENKKDHLYLTE